MRLNTMSFFRGASAFLLITTLIFGYGYYVRQAIVESREVIVKQELIILAVPQIEHGIASWYGRPEHGRTMANGDIYDMFKIHSAAHAKLPFGTIVLITNKRNKKSVIVVVNDRLPRVWLKAGRVIDLSFAAGQEIDMIQAGLVPVELKIIKASKDLTPEMIHKYREVLETIGE